MLYNTGHPLWQTRVGGQELEGTANLPPGPEDENLLQTLSILHGTLRKDKVQFALNIPSFRKVNGVRQGLWEGGLTGDAPCPGRGVPCLIWVSDTRWEGVRGL